jgi:hypothetical protein
VDDNLMTDGAAFAAGVASIPTPAAIFGDTVGATLNTWDGNPPNYSDVVVAYGTVSAVDVSADGVSTNVTLTGVVGDPTSVTSLYSGQHDVGELLIYNGSGGDVSGLCVWDAGNGVLVCNADYGTMMGMIGSVITVAGNWLMTNPSEMPPNVTFAVADSLGGVPRVVLFAEFVSDANAGGWSAGDVSMLPTMDGLSYRWQYADGSYGGAVPLGNACRVVGSAADAVLAVIPAPAPSDGGMPVGLQIGWAGLSLGAAGCSTVQAAAALQVRFVGTN